MLKQPSAILLLITLFLALSGTSAHAEDNTPFVTDTEEYALYIAILFPQQLEQDTLHRAQLSSTIRLDGITGKSYRLYHIAGDHEKLQKGIEPSLINSYNRNNAAPCRFDEATLQSLVPKGYSITLVDSHSATEKEGNFVDSGGITYLSRPGFNHAKTSAIVQISHVADREMGIGYLVYLEKSAPDSRWRITGRDMTRMY